jgi:hypothetical protein
MRRSNLVGSGARPKHQSRGHGFESKDGNKEAKDFTGQERRGSQDGHFRSDTKYLHGI